jgi:hypothetical protein
MVWSIFADLERGLTDEERGAVFAALDELVPGSGCLGPNRHGDEEMYFVVEADSPEAARGAADEWLKRVIAASGVRVGWAITVQRRP